MAISRFAASRLTQGLPKYQSAWDQDNVAQGALEPLGFQITSNSSTTQIFFNSIPQVYQDLMLVVNARQETSTGGTVYVRLNGASANRCYAWLEGDGSSVGSAAAGTSGDGYAQVGTIAPSNATAGVYGLAIGHIFNYTNTVYKKTVLGRSSDDRNGSGRVRLEAALSENTSAVTSIEIVTDGITAFASGSTFALYGIRG